MKTAPFNVTLLIRRPSTASSSRSTAAWPAAAAACNGVRPALSVMFAAAPPVSSSWPHPEATIQSLLRASE